MNHLLYDKKVNFGTKNIQSDLYKPFNTREPEVT